MGLGDETKADPAALRAYSADMRVRVATTRDALGDYQMAIAAFNAAPKEEVEHTIADRSGVIAADLDWLALVDAQPELFAEALEAADRNAFPAGLFGDGLYEAAVQHRFLERLAVEDPDAHAAAVEQLDADERAAGSWLADAGKTSALAYRGLTSLEGTRGVGTELARSGINWGRYGLRSAMRARWERRVPTMADFDRSGPRKDMPRRQRRPLQLQRYREVRRPLRRARRAAADARAAVRTNRPITDLGRRMAARFPRAARALTKGSRLLGRASLPISGLQALYRGTQRDWGGVASSVAGGVGTFLLLSGVGTPVGAVLVAGSLAYEFRDEIGSGLAWARGAVGAQR